MPLPGRVGGLGVELAHGVRAVRQAQAEGGHVELAAVAVGAAADLEHALDRHAAGVRAAVAVEERAGDAPHEVGVEPLVAGRDRACGS